MVIAHILSSFGIGGQERVALDLAAGQHKAGHSVLAISLAPPPDGPLAQDFQAQGVSVHRLAKGPRLDLHLPLRLAAFFQWHRVDVVHTHNPQPLFYGTLGAKLIGTAVVHTKHGANPDRGRRLLMRQASGRLTDAYVAVSAITAAIARGNHECADSHLRIIENGIDLSRFYPDKDARTAIRSELGIAPDAWVIGTVGRLAPEKAHAFLLTAAAPLLSDSVHLVIVGDGPEHNSLRELVGSMPHGRFVHLTGARRDIPRLLASFDVFVLSSTTEGLPLVLPEAMACGLPVVSTAVGGIPHVVTEGKTGFLVPSSDEDALRQQLAHLASNHSLAQECGHQGRETALRRYSALRMVNDYLALYQEVLTRRQRWSFAWRA